MNEPYLSQAFNYFKEYSGQHLLERDGKIRHVTELNGIDALDYLRNSKPSNQKFALTVAFFAPHAWDGKPYPDEYVPQNYTESMYNETVIPNATTGTTEAWKKMPWFFDERNEARRRWRLRYDTPDHYQVTMKRYLRMIKEVDDVVGAVMDELKAQGVYNNTIFIFTSDNGQFNNNHQIAEKWYPHEESIRVPLIIQDPRMPAAMRGTENHDFTLNIDLAPTILSTESPRALRHKVGGRISTTNTTEVKWAPRQVTTVCSLSLRPLG
jgi:arylsulfatase